MCIIVSFYILFSTMAFIIGVFNGISDKDDGLNKGSIFIEMFDMPIKKIFPIYGVAWLVGYALFGGFID